jgi:hypothetical protein
MATKKKAEAEKDQPKEAAAAPRPATPPKKKIGKLVKKDKKRLPRKEKKLAKKKLMSQ